MTAVAPLPPGFAATRDALHALAEHVLCVVRHEATGRIGLVPTPTGVAVQAGDRVVAVDGVELVDSARPAGHDRAPLTTLAAAAAFVGVTPGAPPLWTPDTPLTPDAALTVEPAAAAALTAWFTMVADALAVVAPGGEATLWPEHFDLAVTVDGATLGGSPGDAEHDEPYLYVLPPEGFGRGDDPFWNEPFGASRSRPAVAAVDDAVAFFAAGTSRIAAGGALARPADAV